VRGLPFFLFFDFIVTNLGFNFLIAAVIKNMIGGTEKEPTVVMNAALASSGVLISPLMTFDIEFSMSLSTVKVVKASPSSFAYPMYRGTGQRLCK
jgi:hypothetical protein